MRKTRGGKSSCFAQAWTNQRGLSQVISTLLIIIVALVAIGIVWVVVANIVSQPEQEASTGKFNIDFEIKQVKVEDDGIHVTVKRKPGQGELKGIKFVFSDGKNKDVVEQDTNMKELEEKTFIVDYNGLLTQVGVAPITSSGSIGNIKHEFEVEGRETMKTFPGLVSWWRFEGNANEEMGINNGTVNGAIQGGGKFGHAYVFDGIDDEVVVTDDPSLQIDGSITIAAWVKRKGSLGGTVISKCDPPSGVFIYYLMLDNSGYVKFLYKDDDPAVPLNDELTSSTQVEANKFNHVLGTCNQTHMMLYINGKLDSTREKTTLPSYLLSPLNIGSLSGSAEFNGIIDEVMIFNESLSSDQVETLYKLNLN